MPMTPLRTLIDYYESGQPPPFEWIVEHTPDGTLDELWKTSHEAGVMLYLYALHCSPWQFFDTVRRITLDVIGHDATTKRRRQKIDPDGKFAAWLARASDPAWLLESLRSRSSEWRPTSAAHDAPFAPEVLRAWEDSNKSAAGHAFGLRLELAVDVWRSVGDKLSDAADFVRARTEPPPLAVFLGGQ